MKNNIIPSVLGMPDAVLIQTEPITGSCRKESAWCASDPRLTFECGRDYLRVILHPTGEPILSVSLRFSGDLSFIRQVLGDAVERAYENDAVWHTVLPKQKLPWYFHASDGTRLYSYGVKTGGNAFAYWFCDPRGITLLLDVRNAGGGTVIPESLPLADLVMAVSAEGESPFAAAKSFCRQMCSCPKIPKEPAYGFNTWYWSYGNIREDTVLHEAESLGGLTCDLPYRPYLVIDDGWQSNRSNDYNGGPWNAGGEGFGSMQETAHRIHEKGCKAGVWLRPLLTRSFVPPETRYDSPYQKYDTVLDPTHPFSKETICRDIRCLSDWGFDLIKHDFTSLDLFARDFNRGLPPHFHDRTVTNAQILKELYRTISDAAGDETVILGCNTVGHLCAGIHEVQRIGGDSSGKRFEQTRDNGIHSLMRMPQNGSFFQTDPDCAVFTSAADASVNLDFLEAAAITGSAVFASVTPDILSDEQKIRMHDIFSVANRIRTSNYAEILDWEDTAVPSDFLYLGQTFRYDWYRSMGTSHIFFQ